LTCTGHEDLKFSRLHQVIFKTRKRDNKLRSSKYRYFYSEYLFYVGSIQMKTVLSKFLRRIRNDDGFTLAEVMVAFSVLAIIGTAATFALVNSTGIISNNETKDAATQYVRDYMESAKAVEYSLLGFSTGDSTAASTVIRGGSNYPQVRASGMTTSANGLAPRVNRKHRWKKPITSTHTSTGLMVQHLQTPSPHMNRKLLKVEVWESGALVAAGLVRKNSNRSRICSYRRCSQR